MIMQNNSKYENMDMASCNNADCVGVDPHWPHKPDTLVRFQDPLLGMYSLIGRASGC